MMEKTILTAVLVILAALMLALALVLPFLTGQIPQIGSMLCPMHLPVLLCKPVVELCVYSISYFCQRDLVFREKKK